MSTTPDTRQIPDDILQAAIEEAGQKACLEHDLYSGLIQFKPDDERFTDDAPARLALARGLLARLPEPTPPVSADGKTPGQVAFENFQQRGLTAWSDSSYQTNYEAAASAVLAAFGQGGLEAAIARMEAVPWKTLEKAWDDCGEGGIERAFNAVRARLIAAARDGQGEAVDWKARAEKAEIELAAVTADKNRLDKRLTEMLLAPSSLPQLRPIAEAGPVPEGCVRVGVLMKTEGYVINPTMAFPSHFADIRLPSPAASQDSQPATFEANGKTWTRHTPGDPMPCDGEAFVDCFCEGGGTLLATRAKLWSWSGDIIGWRYADEPAPAPAWQPAAGDVVQLNSGGPVMAVNAIESKGLLDLIWISPDGYLQSASLAAACLTPAQEAQP